MSNLSEFPTGRQLLLEMGGICVLEEEIGIHTILATERGFGGDTVGISEGTADLPGVCFRFERDRVNYCKILLFSSADSVHIEFRNLLTDEQVVAATVPKVSLRAKFFEILNAVEQDVLSHPKQTTTTQESVEV